MPENKRTKMPKMDDLKRASQIFRYVRPYKVLFTINIVLLIVTSLTSLAIPYFAGDLIDVAQGIQENFKNVNEVAIIMASVLFVQAILSFVRIIFQTKFTESAMIDLRTELYQKIITLPTSYLNQTRVGDLTSRISNDVTTLQETFSTTLPQFVRQSLIMVAGIAALSYLNLRLTLTMLAVIPVVVISAIVFGRFIRKLSKEKQDKLAESNTIVEETLQAIQSVKAFTNELFETKRYRGSIYEAYKLAIKGSMYRGAFIAFISIGFMGAIVFILWQASLMLSTGVITGGEFVQYIMMTIFITASLAGLGESLTGIQRAVGATDRVEELLSEQVELIVNENDGIPFHFTNRIEFKNVTFAYPGKRDTNVLKDINLTIHKGEQVALVGSSGAGKSTIAQLLLRFYNVDEGAILIDDVPNNEIDLHDYRKNIGFVPQEVLLFGGSIIENIRYGKNNATEEEIISAAKSANAWEFIEKFPDKLDTIVGERGLQLSGGQKQRIAIARALLKNPPILILDEATSALDAESEHLVQGALDNLMANRTTLVIAHRLSTVRKADKILVLDDGSVTEQGNHNQLMEQQGIYSNLVSLQLQNA